MSIKEVKIVTVRETGPVGDSFRSPSKIEKIWHESVTGASWYDSEKEAFVVFLLDRKNRVKSWQLVSLGTVDSSIVHPREVFRAAVVASACSIIVAHNHPSGDATPSTEDIKVTTKLIEAGKLLGIGVLDHVIIGDKEVYPDGYLSFRKKGLVTFQ